MAGPGASAHHSRVTDLQAPLTVSDLRARSMIRAAVLHLADDQPLLVDLFGLPSPSDPVLVCTNVRSLTGKRPVWVDHVQSVYYFPWVHIRFVEIPPGIGETVGGVPAVIEAAPPSPMPDLEADLEIDEDFLRRVREV